MDLVQYGQRLLGAVRFQHAITKARELERDGSPRRKKDSKPRYDNQSAQCSLQFGGDFFGRNLDRISREVGVSGSGLHLRMAEQLADHRQPLAGGNGGRGEGMPEIVDADVLQPGPVSTAD